jgi:hypothetical protein
MYVAVTKDAAQRRRWAFSETVTVGGEGAFIVNSPHL